MDGRHHIGSATSARETVTWLRERDYRVVTCGVSGGSPGVVFQRRDGGEVTVADRRRRKT